MQLPNSLLTTFSKGLAYATARSRDGSQGLTAGIQKGLSKAGLNDGVGQEEEKCSAILNYFLHPA